MVFSVKEIIGFTMLQKLSKCEVKAWLCLNLIILLLLRFYVKSIFGEFKQFKNVILRILEVLNFDFSKIEQLSSSITKNSKSKVWNCQNRHFQTVWIYQNLISHKIWVAANCKISTPCCLNFRFWKFLEHSGVIFSNFRTL